jgi:2-keto-4-pentenoate hydratase
MAGGLAEQLWRARCDGGTLPRHAADGVRATEDAYCVQRDAVQWSGLARAGWKVGATSEAAQTLLDAGGPATAPLLAPLCFSSPTELAMFPGQNTSVESEFAFRFAQPLPARDADYVLDEVLDAVGTLMPAIEVVATMSAIRRVSPRPGKPPSKRHATTSIAGINVPTASSTSSRT